MTRILIKNCLLVPMREGEGEEGPYYRGEVAVEGGRILAAGPLGTVARTWEPEQVLEAGGMACLPGLVNCHTHAAMTLFRGYADDLPLQEWLEKKIWPLEARLTAEDIYWGSLLACLEMLKSGTTTFADMYFEMPMVAKAVEESGIRAVLARGLIGIQPNGGQALEENVKFVKEYQGAAGGRITAMLGPHAPYTCPPSYLEKVIELSEELKVGLHIHLAETAGEVQDISRLYGKTPVQLMAEVGLFRRPVLAAHCVHLTEEDIALLADGGVGVAHNPQSNMKLASGVAPVPRLLQAGVVVGLGTDGAASNNNLDLLEEMRSAALLHKVTSGDPTVLNASQALSMATREGARALGLAGEIGTIQTGKQADLILINIEKPHLYPRHDLLAHLVYAARSSDVDTVMVAGQVLVRGGKCLTLDEAEICRQVEKRARRLVEGL